MLNIKYGKHPVGRSEGEDCPAWWFWCWFSCRAKGSVPLRCLGFLVSTEKPFQGARISLDQSSCTPWNDLMEIWTLS